MAKEMIVNATSLEIRVAILEDNQVSELFIERRQDKAIVGNLYKGRVERVLPGMQAAFVDIGLERNAFLYVTDIFEDYTEYSELFEETDQVIAELERQEALETPRDPVRQEKVNRDEPDSRLSASEPLRPEPFQPPVNPAWTRPVFHRLRLAILPDQLDFHRPEGFIAKKSEPVAQSRLPLMLADLEDEKELEAEATIEENFDVSLLAKSKSNQDGGGTKNGESGKNRGNRTKKSGRHGDRQPVPKIGELLTAGQEILVQVAKEPIGRKGARITSHVVLPGRYLVFMPTVDHVGVSRRIESAKERQRLKNLIDKLRGDIDRGFIVRTAGANKQESDFRQDMIYLTRLWEQIRARSEKKSAPALLHAELDLVERVIRDFFTDDFRAIRIDNKKEYERITEFVANFNPDLAKKVKPYTKDNPIFDEFNINAEIEKALQSKVWLKSGGYVVINQTEALVAIDVNTGRYVGKTSSLEDTITKTNLEAVSEVVRQIRLRDLGGIIVIDFIDMNDARNRNRVMDALHQELGKDKSPSKILQFNEFGLVAITRKRVKQSLERSLCQPCEHCNGTGRTKSPETIALNIHQEVRKLKKTMGRGDKLLIRCNPTVASQLRSEPQIILAEIQQMTGKDITLKSDPTMGIEQFELLEL